MAIAVRHHRTALIGLAALVTIQLWFLLPLFGRYEPAGDDLSVHLAEIAYLARAFRAGDFSGWNPSANLGFQSGLYYQILPQLVPAVSSALLGDRVPLLLLFKIAITIPLVLLPVTVYRALRVSGLAPAIAWGGAAAAGLVSGASKWGLGIDSIFTTGLYTQAWGMLFFPLAIAYASSYLLDGRWLLRAVSYALLTGLCHPFLGIALAPALLIVPWWRGGRAAALRGMRRGAVLLALTLGGSAFFWGRILIHYDGFGGFFRVKGEDGVPAATLLGLLVRGEILDKDRLPILTLALIAPLIWARRGVIGYLLGAGGLFGALVALGPAVGKVGEKDLLPAIRFLAPMQLALAAAAGCGCAVAFGLMWKRAGVRMRSIRIALVTAFAAALLFAIKGSKARATALVRLADQIPGVERDELESMLEKLRELPRGRLLASTELGTGSHWWMYLPAVYADKPALIAWGGAALQSSASFRYLRAFRPREHAALYGVRYVLMRARPPAQPNVKPRWQEIWPDSKLLHATKNHVLVELPGASLFAPIEVIGTIPAEGKERERKTLEWLRSADVQRGRHYEIGAARGHMGPGGKVTVLREWELPSGFGALIDVVENKAANVLIRLPYDSQFRSTTNGMDLGHRHVTPGLIAVTVENGLHEVIVTYR